jgi:hypothetical protein
VHANPACKPLRCHTSPQAVNEKCSCGSPAQSCCIRAIRLCVYRFRSTSLVR